MIDILFNYLGIMLYQALYIILADHLALRKAMGGCLGLTESSGPP
jgi:hypothetical protein